MVYPDNRAADEHFNNLRQQFGSALQSARALADEATDSLAFVAQSAQAMEERTAK